MGRRDPQKNSQFSILRADSLNDVNSLFNLCQTLAFTLPFRHPARAVIAHDIATCHMSRYKATRQKGDLDQAIVGYAEALLRGMNHPPMNIEAFNHLTHASLIRFDDFGMREDLDHIISYSRHLPNLSLEVAGITRLNVLNGLANALRSDSKLEGDWRTLRT
ncbi:hypothetical protein BJV78DRAFT_1281741 [Lactifluus subvellereus]|nr:hypothetical protein BJV78DRAFT_1281741 [Lactifluus subvellereus]